MYKRSLYSFAFKISEAAFAYYTGPKVHSDVAAVNVEDQRKKKQVFDKERRRKIRREEFSF